MVSTRTRKDKNGGIEQQKEENEGGVAEYEQSREERIKQNLQRMQALGILELSRKLKPQTGRPPNSKPKPKPLIAPSGSPRRSSRIKILPAVSYLETEKRVPKEKVVVKKRVPKEKVLKNIVILIKEGSKPEVYTEEHEKMLGDHQEAWELMVDGYDDEKNRMYDEYAGKSCHQCRQKTIGHRTKCCKCTSVQGQLCGDCLFTRYGENVLEANANPFWVCPVCRDICNCNRCRRVKGWEPTGDLYKKTLYLGYKSVAHYLIHTRGPHGKQEDRDNETVGLPTDKEGEQLVEKDGDNMDED
ncbi:putative Zinc-finger domain of monoamine-oxidase A repressor R1 [Helianthus annuus]|nr:putative Zinc-finger domain of monoamine-oxidase A repressor R1 [Helianthus annuus]KAJ0608030.1 putative Zinc-finger domain of monoamine-oxidase A repressor R1 [Helianthus annuus]KAJ0935717.1 putative Zinc-finger domain of monoamine-oxidase A repressor R1 [Helianthus annuus]KAJ0943642.1 putative Zinc-finger domain of monoamine-oxidase A repressor R1 [Helianthus annuus]